MKKYQYVNGFKPVKNRIRELISQSLGRLGEKSYPVAPFGNAPRNDRNFYRELFNKSKIKEYHEITTHELNCGFSIEKSYIDDLALHTQVVQKESDINFSHGRILYSTLRLYLSSIPSETLESIHVNILETGTARGFSAVCMAKALIDSAVNGNVVSVDAIAHNDPMYWNIIDDFDGKKTREQLLSSWPSELERIIFIQGWTNKQLPRLGISRIHFAFLDAQHSKEDVLSEFDYVQARQSIGDIIVFDDVTPGYFDGVVEAIEEIQKLGTYAIKYIAVSSQRGYALATKLR